MICGACGALLVDEELNLSPEELRSRAESIARAFSEITNRRLNNAGTDWDSLNEAGRTALVDVFVEMLDTDVIS